MYAYCNVKTLLCMQSINLAGSVYILQVVGSLSEVVVDL